MKLISVHPLILLPQKLQGPFTYFSRENIPDHSLVEVSFNKKNTLAIVETMWPLASNKSEIKKYTYSLKRIHKIISSNLPFHPSLFSIATKISKYSLEPAGSILKSFIASVLLKEPTKYLFGPLPHPHFHQRQHETILGTLEERVAQYKTIVREAFAKKRSVVIFVPTIQLAEYVHQRFSVFSKSEILVHGSTSKKNLFAGINLIRNSNTARLIIGTPIALGHLRGDEGIIIIEDADNRHYIRHERPRIYTTAAIRMFAQEIQAKLISGKYIPSLEDLKNNIHLNYLSPRHKKGIENRIIDLSQKDFTPLSEPLETLLESEPPRRFIIFLSRKGLYSFVICRDCGWLVACPTCKKPLVLHAASKRYYACHNCNKSSTVDVACQNCSGWNLQGYGFGTERIYTEIKKTMPSRPIWLYDDESAATRTKQQMIKKEFLSSRDGILIGSELIIEDPELTADQVLIAHIDNLFSIPDYRMNERILTLLAKLEERSKESPLLIQTKFPKHPLFKYFLEDHSKRFLEQELEERKTEELPPYTALIVISFTAKNKKEADKQTLYIRKSLESLVLSVDTLPTLTQGIKTSIILTIEKNVWLRESDELKKIFFKNMDRWDIAVDPDTIV